MDSKTARRSSWGTLHTSRRGPRWPLLLWLVVISLLLVPASRTLSKESGTIPAARPPALQLANVYDDVDLDQYWVSEKLDGVRAYWDGARLVSRKGTILNAPAWFTHGFPAVSLDGELWMGRGTFAALSAAVRRHVPVSAEWRKIRYMVFDLPASAATFDERMAALRRVVAESDTPYLKVVEQVRVAGKAALEDKLRAVVNGGGEGLMLRRGASLYHAGRSDDLLKLKPYHDAEARVLAHLPGKGKYQGMLGALLVERPDGRQFRVGTGFSDAERRHPPPVGTLITYQYRGLTRTGLPRFPSYLRIRE